MKINDMVTPSHWMTHECLGISYDDCKFKVIGFLNDTTISIMSLLTGKLYNTFVGNFKLLEE